MPSFSSCCNAPVRFIDSKFSERVFVHCEKCNQYILSIYVTFDIDAEIKFSEQLKNGGIA